VRSKFLPEGSWPKRFIYFFPALVAIVAALFLLGGPLGRLIRESFMEHITSAHYEVLAPANALSKGTMEQFAARRETVFATLNQRLGTSTSNAKIRVVLDPAFPGTTSSATSEQPYSVSGTTIRTKLIAGNPALPAAADAEALLFAAWGKPGNDRIARWTATWLTGDWRGSEIGMAAAEVEQKFGYKNLQFVLDDSPTEIAAGDSQDLLGAAWISEVAEFGGEDTVRKLYSARMRRPNMADITKVLGTSQLELERKWQMWSYAYLAGMPPMSRNSTMPMNMPTEGSH